MTKLRAETIKKINRLLENRFVNNYHKTMLRSILHDSQRNNIQKAQVEMLPIILSTYEGFN